MITHHDQQSLCHSMHSSSTSQMQYQLESVWPSPSESNRDDVVSFWMTELPSSELTATRERAHQLLVVARDPDGNVAGVSTALRMHVVQLGFECFFYRTFVGQTHRVRGVRSTELGWKILHESYRLLNERFQQGDDPGVLGLYAEMENPSIMKCRNETVWQEDGMNFVFIGKTQGGRHIRVWYFDGARVP
jgi:hypothetical protein